MSINKYSNDFYLNQRSGSSGSAKIVVPLVNAMFQPKSVVDVGCGTGTWLAEFQSLGVSDVFGIDGSYVDRKFLLIPQERFQPFDLAKPLELSRTFDLACSLEVGEHIPTTSSTQFVRGLTQLAPVVLFSAAIPGQGGTDHINEQWQFYWFGLFRSHGFVAVDCVRPQIYSNDSVSWWYRQNIIVYCLPDHVPAGCLVVDSEYQINRILPAMTTGPRNGTQAVQAIHMAIPLIVMGVRRKLGLVQPGM